MPFPRFGPSRAPRPVARRLGGTWLSVAIRTSRLPEPPGAAESRPGEGPGEGRRFGAGRLVGAGLREMVLRVRFGAAGCHSARVARSDVSWPGPARFSAAGHHWREPRGRAPLARRGTICASCAGRSRHSGELRECWGHSLGSWRDWARAARSGAIGADGRHRGELRGSGAIKSAVGSHSARAARSGAIWRGRAPLPSSRRRRGRVGRPVARARRRGARVRSSLRPGAAASP